jgi:Sulfotransferase family
MANLTFLQKIGRKTKDLIHECNLFTYRSFRGNRSNFDRPIFILAAPRSGSTLLFECLSACKELYHVGREADAVWWRVFPYERGKTPSDFVGLESVANKSVEALRARLFASAVAHHFSNERGLPQIFILPYLLGTQRIRYIDKTIANCFHLDFLHAAFPDAQYVFLVRDPRAVISSMLEGWPYWQFGKARLTPFLRGLNSTIEKWTYPAPPGWQSIVSRPLPEICAWSWRQHIEHVLQFLRRQGANREVNWVRYESLISDVPGTIEALCSKFDLELTEKAKHHARTFPWSQTTVSAPSPDKWMKTRRKEIQSILPMIESTAKEIGYDVTVT